MYVEELRGQSVTGLANISGKLEVICRTGATLLMIFMMALVFLEVISRYIFQASHGFVDDLSVWLMVWLTYLMIGGIFQGRQHISVDILPTRLPERYRTHLFIIIDIITLIFAITLCWGGIQFSHMVKQMNILSYTVFGFPMWIVRLCVPLGGILLALFSAERLIAGIHSLGKHRRAHE